MARSPRRICDKQHNARTATMATAAWTYHQQYKREKKAAA